MTARPQFLMSTSECDNQEYVAAEIERMVEDGTYSTDAEPHFLIERAMKYRNQRWDNDAYWDEARTDSMYVESSKRDRIIELLRDVSDLAELGRLFQQMTATEFAEDCVNEARTDWEKQYVY